jgi:hypothetical protein
VGFSVAEKSRNASHESRVAVGVGVLDAVGVSVGVPVVVEVGTSVAVPVGVDVGESVALDVGVEVPVGVGVIVGVKVSVGLAVSVDDEGGVVEPVGLIVKVAVSAAGGEAEGGGVGADFLLQATIPISNTSIHIPKRLITAPSPCPRP